MVGYSHSGPRKATAPPLSRLQAWWGKHRRSISRLIVMWRRKSSEPYTLEYEVMKADLDKVEADEEEAKAIAGFLRFMVRHGGRAPVII